MTANLRLAQLTSPAAWASFGARPRLGTRTAGSDRTATVGSGTDKGRVFCNSGLGNRTWRPRERTATASCNTRRTRGRRSGRRRKAAAFSRSYRRSKAGPRPLRTARWPQSSFLHRPPKPGQKSHTRSRPKRPPRNTASQHVLSGRGPHAILWEPLPAGNRSRKPACFAPPKRRGIPRDGLTLLFLLFGMGAIPPESL